VEAWLDAYGWVTFDPTPASTPARSQIASLEEPAQRADSAADDRAADAAGEQSGEQGRLRPDLLRDPQRGTEEEPGAASDDGGPAWWLYALAFAALAALGAALLLRRSARAQVPALDRAIAELEAALRRAGRPAPPSETLSQLERRLDLRGDAAAYVRALRAGRYAPAAPLPTRAQRSALRRELAEGLGFSGWLRALWALPPWARR
jgi:MYXO-CTERM domain-containing protein